MTAGKKSGVGSISIVSLLKAALPQQGNSPSSGRKDLDGRAEEALLSYEEGHFETVNPLQWVFQNSMKF